MSVRTPAGRSPRRVGAVRAILATLAIAVAGAYVALQRQGYVPVHAARPEVVAEIAGLAILAQLYPIKFAPKRVTTASLGAAFALALCTEARVSLPFILATQLVGQTVLAFRSQRGWVSVIFNPLQTSLAAVVAVSLLSAVPQPALAVVLAGAGMYAASALLVSGMTVCWAGVSWRKALFDGRRESLEHGAGTLFVGWLIVAALQYEALVPLVMVLPAAALSVAASRLQRMQAQSTALAHAEEQVRIRKEFLQVAAHELRTPITSLGGYADFVRFKLESGYEVAPEAMGRAMSTIVAQSRRLTRLIDQLLDFTRVEQNRMILQRERVDLRPLLQSVVEEIEGISPGALIILRAPDTLQALVDPLRLEQVVVNLLTNAVKFSPTGSPIEVSLVREHHDARIEVRDYGDGVPAEKREAIFHPFEQAHRDSAVGGLGLGLYVSRQIVEAHAGTIRVQPAGERGSRFIVALPDVVEDHPPVEESAPARAAVAVAA